MADKTMSDSDLKDILQKRKEALEFLKISDKVILTHCLNETGERYIYHKITKVVNYDKLNSAFFTMPTTKKGSQ